MNFAHLRAFHAVATEGSVVRAAHKLGVSQPTLSQQIKALAERHQAPLFERRGSRLELSSLGLTLLEATTRLMDELSAVEEVLRSAGDTEIGGRLRIGADGPGHAAAMLVEFRRAHPLPSVSMMVGNAETTLKQLQGNEIDVAIVADPIVQSGFVYSPIGFDMLRLVCSADHPLAGLTSVTIARVATETLIVREQGSKTRALVRRLLDATGVHPTHMIEIGTREAGREVIARGMGIGFFCPRNAATTDGWCIDPSKPDHHVSASRNTCSARRTASDSQSFDRSWPSPGDTRQSGARVPSRKAAPRASSDDHDR